MTVIREPNYMLDLPGAWEAADTGEPGAAVYVERDGTAKVTVLLLAVRPLFAIADQRRLLEDYLHHRPQYEKGARPSLDQTAAVTYPGDVIEGGWAAIDAEAGRSILHRVVLTDGLLADIAYEADSRDQAAFVEAAGAVLAGVVVTAPAGGGPGLG